MNSALRIVGRIEISPAALNHRFVAEALGAALVLQDSADGRHRVIGTSDSRLCELYGWAPNVPGHRDNSGWIYGLMLNEGISYIHARRYITKPAAEITTVRVQQGDVFRLNDYHEHWTDDVTARIAVFIGPFEEPRDEAAIAELRRGLLRLEAGDYYGAPRTKDGFRAMQPDECYAANDDFADAEVMLLADARRNKRCVIECSKCSTPAVRLDDHWPYYWDHNRCREHLVGNVRNARGDSPPKAGESAGPADKDPMGEAVQFDPEDLAGDARAALPPAPNDDRQSRPSMGRAHEAPELGLAGEGAL